MRPQTSRFVIVTAVSALFACASSSVRIKVDGVLKEYPEPQVRKASIELKVVNNECVVVDKSSTVKARRHTDEVIWRIKHQCEGDHKLEIRFTGDNPMKAPCDLTAELKGAWGRVFCSVADVVPKRYAYKIYLDGKEAADPDVEIYQ